MCTTNPAASSYSSSCSQVSHITYTLPTRLSRHFKTTPLNVSYAREDIIALAVILPVILYIREPLFLIDSVLEDLPAMPRKTGCPQSRYKRFSGCPPIRVLRTY